MKRTLTTALAMALCLTLAACGANAATPDTTQPLSGSDENPTAVTVSPTHAENPNLAIRISPEEEHYIFELSDNVERTHVYYYNRFGIEMAGDLYVAKDADLTRQYPALIVGPPFGGVKEQGPGVYANELAQRGFVVLAFDPAYHGYSGGEPRMAGSSALYAEDFCAGVDYLGTLDYVDREKIGAIGICGSGGFALSAAAMDTRIKAVATSVMYDIAGNMNSVGGDARTGMIAMASQQRWDDIGAYMTSYPETPTADVPAELTGTNAEFYEFYGTPRGHHPNALGNVTTASMADIMNFPGTTHIAEINAPILFVAGENAHSLDFSKTAYESASEPKELYIVPDAIHIDLYDDVSKIPFDKFTEFFNANLK